MAQLYFKYGAMNSGKSIDILKVAHNYEEQAKPVLLMTSHIDTRTGKGKIASRIGIEREAVIIDEETDIVEIVRHLPHKIYCLILDEAQFLSQEHVHQLARVVDDFQIPVMAYGLKNDFQNHLFEGSRELLLYADKIEEIKTICWFCPKKATMNLRLSDQRPVYTGEQIQIGGNESYWPVCRKHYHNPPLDASGQVVTPSLTH